MVEGKHLIFVQPALQEMVKETAFNGPDVMVIDKENGFSYYKSAAHM